jgi:Tol biopolymer transport system component
MLIYYTPAAKRGEPGTLWEISALGGWPRRLAAAMGGGDVSHDGQRIALLEPTGEQLALVTVARDGSHAERVALLPAGSTYSRPRWSPDDREIALERAGNAALDVALDVVPAAGGDRQVVTRSALIQGHCWLPDGAGLVYGSSRGSTLHYPPVINLRTTGRRGEGDSPLTFGDVSYVDPDVDASGKLLATRIRSHSDIWKFPVEGSPAENVRSSIRITHQTGHVRTPSVSPDGAEVVYLSDTGGHGNLWIARTDQSGARQITFETDPAAFTGVPKWSPRGDLIVFVVTRSGQAGLWKVHPDGSGLREIVARGWGPAWSGDGRWLYYQSFMHESPCVEKIPIDGGEPIVVRMEPDAAMPHVMADGSGLYFIVTAGAEAQGLWWRSGELEIRRARPENGRFETVGRIPNERIPGAQPIVTLALSPDGRRLATALIDGATTNLWEMSVADGSLRQLTDFGDRQTMISRSVAWSADGRYLYAAVEESERDIVLIDGLL